MTGRYVLSPRAQADLDDIWQYTLQRWGIDQATIYISEIQRQVETVADRPDRGRPCPEVLPGYRKLSSGLHVLFYRMLNGGIDVVRILHGRMDFKVHLATRD